MGIKQVVQLHGGMEDVGDGDNFLTSTPFLYLAEKEETSGRLELSSNGLKDLL